MAVHSVYVLAWPDGIWKVGYSANVRERMHSIRLRPTLVDRHDFTSRDEALLQEKALQFAFRKIGDRAFWSIEEARHLFGQWAIGYTECVRIHAGGHLQLWDPDQERTFLRIYNLAWAHLPLLPEWNDSFVAPMPAAEGVPAAYVPLVHRIGRVVA